MVDYIVGKQGGKFLALNHILLELQKTIFYSTNEEISSHTFCEKFLNKIKSIILKEKCIFSENNKYESFVQNGMTSPKYMTLEDLMYN